MAPHKKCQVLISPVFHTTRIIGLAPLSVVKGGSSTSYQSSFLLLFYSVVYLFVLTSIYLLRLQWIFQEVAPSNIRNVDNWTFFAKEVLLLVSGLLIGLLSLIQSFQLQTLLEKVCKVDETLKITESRQRKTCRFSVLYLALYLAYFIVENVLYGLAFPYGLTWNVIAYFTMTGYWIGVSMQFVALCREIESRFSQLSEEIFECFKDEKHCYTEAFLHELSYDVYSCEEDRAKREPKDEVSSIEHLTNNFIQVSSCQDGVHIPKIQIESEIPDSVDTLEEIRSVYDSMCDVVDVFNRAFGIRLLMIVLYKFFDVIFNIFCCIYKGKFMFVHHLETTLVVTAVLQVTQFFLLVFPGNCVMAEAQKVEVMLHKLRNQRLHTCIKEEVELFSSLLKRRKVKINACGVFAIDSTLAFWIIALVITYVVLLSQALIIGH